MRSQPAASVSGLLSLALLVGAAQAPPLSAQMPEAPPVEEAPAPAAPVVEAGRFDNGKMWTFEYPPVDYFQEAYGFTADDAWLARARLGALRIPNCSASLVSPNGLVMTNHHCAREFVSQVSGEGEQLLDDGFYAPTLEDERPLEDFTADQLIEVLDVTDQVYAALEGIEDAAARSQRREEVTEALGDSIRNERGGEEAGIEVEIISLWAGARYSAYVFRRYTEATLVMAPELQIGFFGGDPDNFTYPRYNLDMAFFRVYDDGEPLQNDAFFPFNTEGARPGDPVFIIGNPGSTSRLQTVAELEFRRDVSDLGVLEFIQSRAQVLSGFIEAFPEQAEAMDLRNSLFSLLNSEKSYLGQLRGLNDPEIMARRLDAEQKFQAAIDADPELQAQFGNLIASMAELQEGKRQRAGGFHAYLGMTAEHFASATLRRALFGFQIIRLQGQVPEEQLRELKDQFLAVEQQSAVLDQALVEARIGDFQRGYGEDAPFIAQLLDGRTPEGAAAVLVESSALSDSAGAAAALEAGLLSMSDPAIVFFTGFLQPFGEFQSVLGQSGPQEEEIAAAIGRARFSVYGTSEPPDATFSLRIADGVVKSYEYNGTAAPEFTTFYGLYDRHFSHAGEDDWALPDRWLNPPSTLDLSTPMNFVATVDIIGGNSGSPVLDQDLQVVGLVFDGNIESLPGDYIYLPEAGNRSVAADARGILEALEEIYQAERIVEELTAARVGAGGSH